MSDTTTMAEMQGSKECNYCLGMGCLHCLGRGTVPVTPHRAWPTPEDMADSQLELDVERVERALQWERCKERINQCRDKVRAALGHIHGAPRPTALSELSALSLLMAQAHLLVVNLDELERLEEAGGGL